MPSLKRIIVSMAVTAIVLLILWLGGLHRLLSSMLAGPADDLRSSLHGAAQEAPEEQGPVSDELVRLRMENAELRLRIREYDRINSELGTRVQPEQILRSRIISRSSSAGHHYVHIDRGALDGVHVGDPVLVGWTLIGIVRGEAADHSLVQLITDQDARVAASLYAIETAQGVPSAQYDSPLAQGIIKGMGDRWSIAMGHVEARSQLEIMPGMQVVTSGLEPNIPFGLIIGNVTTAGVSPDSDLWDISLRPNRLWGSYPTVVVLRQLSALTE